MRCKCHTLIRKSSERTYGDAHGRKECFYDRWYRLGSMLGWWRSIWSSHIQVPGPVGGVNASLHLAREIGTTNINKECEHVCYDMNWHMTYFISQLY